LGGDPVTPSIGLFPLIHFTVFIFHLGVISFILYKNPHSWINRTCAILISTFALWSFAYGFLPITDSGNTAFYWVTVAFIGGITQPVATFYLYLGISGKDKLVKNMPLLCAIILAELSLIYLQFSGHQVFSAGQTNLGWIARPADTVYYWLFLIFCQLLFYISFIILIVFSIKTKVYREKLQARWILVASLAALIPGTLTNAILPLLNLGSYAHWGDIPYLIWEIGLILAVTKFGLMSLSPVTASNEILSTMSDSLFLLDNQGSIKMANRAALEFFNVENRRLIDRQFDSIVKDPASISAILQEASQKGKSLNHELHYIQPDKGSVTLQVSVSLVHDRLNTPLGFVLVARDITELKLLEISLRDLYAKELEQRKELQEEAKERGMFIDILAHELRTPLTPILSTSSMLGEIVGLDSTGPLSKLARILNDSAHTMAQRLDELLDLARYSRGSFKIDIQPCNLKEFFTSIIPIFESGLNGSGHKLIVEIPDNLSTVNIDAPRLEQVINNLLSNADKYNSPTGNIYLKVLLTQTELRIEVKDEGIGIPNDEIVNIFKPYHRVQQNKRIPGLGLGLAVCKQIIEAHNGKIWVESKPGTGSVFGFQVPI
jgi:PAS domain S-box-containing protein